MIKVKSYIIFLLLFTVALSEKSSGMEVRAPIDKAVNKGITFVAKKAKSWFGKSNKGKEKVNKKVVDDQAKKDEQDEKQGKVVKLKPIDVKMNGESHTLTFESGKVMMASVKGSLAKKLYQAKLYLEEVKGTTEGQKVDVILSGVKRLHGVVVSLEKQHKKAKKKDKSAIEAKLKRVDGILERFGSQHKLKDISLEALKEKFADNPKVRKEASADFRSKVSAANAEVKSDVGVAGEKYLSKREYVVASDPAKPFLGPIFYGTVVERATAEKVDGNYIRTGGPNKEDFKGRGKYEGLVFDVTTAKAVQAHLKRKYGKRLIIGTYKRPDSFVIFP